MIFLFFLFFLFICRCNPYAGGAGQGESALLLAHGGGTRSRHRLPLNFHRRKQRRIIITLLLIYIFIEKKNEEKRRRRRRQKKKGLYSLHWTMAARRSLLDTSAHSRTNNTLLEASSQFSPFSFLFKEIEKKRL